MQCDYLIVGSGLYGATFAYFAKKAGKKCLVIEKRSEVGGNVFCQNIEGINVHKYGAHIFHTSNKKVWDFVNSFVEFNRYTNSPVANFHGKLFNLPFNMNTFYQMWGVTTPDEAKAKIEEQKKSSGITEPKNLEEQAISLVGRDIYETLVKEYTEKQWGRKCTELPAFKNALTAERTPVPQMDCALPPPITEQHMLFSSIYTRETAPPFAEEPQEIPYPSKAGPAAEDANKSFCVFEL